MRVNHYYSILHLQLHDRISINSDVISVDIRGIRSTEIITNDHERDARRKPGSFFFVSGGGSYIVDERYLLVVQRDANTLVNPNMYSLFTGRSNDAHEWINPDLCVRELFEEVTLYVDGGMVSLINQRFQSLIDSHYKTDSKSKKSTPLQINLVEQSTLNLVITSDHGSNEHKLPLIVSKNGDINCVFVFDLEVSLSRLSAIDKEDGGLERKIHVIDIETLSIKPLANFDSNNWKALDNLEMTDNLIAVINDLR